MAPLEVSALARAARTWLPVGVTGCAPGRHAVAGQVASCPPSPLRPRAPPIALPGGSPPTQWARRSRAPGFAATSCQINPCKPRGEDPLPVGGERTE